MSATRRGAERQPSDFYATPAEVCDAAIAVVPMRSPDAMVLDAGAGTGAWGASLRRTYADLWIEGIDIEPRTKPDGVDYDEWHAPRDFLSVTQADIGTYDAVIGNPPFSLAEEFVRHAHTMIAPNGVVAFLLRLNFLEGKKRGDGLWKEFPLSGLYVYSARPSFTGDGKTDAAAYALFVWNKGHRGKFTGGWL